MEKVIEMKGITKIFPGVIANEKVDFDLLKGEIHVLLGENGAGKTTLMNVLYGLYQQEEGSLFVNGKEEKIGSPARAIELGIGMIHQHFMLVDIFTVTENIILGNEPLKGGTVDMEQARKEVKALADRYGFQIHPDDLIKDITVGQQQKVEILKALYRNTDILILDEPTAVLTPQEIDELEIILRNLTKEGKSVILITHKLKEIMRMSDRVTILRRGKVVGQVATGETDISELAELMVGRKVKLFVDKEPHEPGEAMLCVKGLNYKDERGVLKVKNLSFTARRGEILGIAGVDGNGQAELVDLLTGLLKPASGSILLEGEEVAGKSCAKIIEEGISSIPEDRHKRGLVLDFPLYENAILGQHRRKQFSRGISLNYPFIKEYTRGLIRDFDIRTPSDSVPARSLSGGNQQKLVAAREISKDPKVLIAAQPTRGLDVGAIEYIHKRIIAERDKDKAVLLVSLELDEVMALSDRIAVIYDGEIQTILNAEEANEHKLGILMAGGTLQEERKAEVLKQEAKELRNQMAQEEASLTAPSTPRPQPQMKEDHPHGK
ncbi:Unspecified monosaccharide ABC transport system, ATP-binding protein [Clostridiaceae bacterium JG1575]|nr:Unspecified monosaccharide ABC transport system, ATP-binding protein [Clostridiaceae bacterium JG1575]